ncbi:unnamed protein product [Durusdinium trenchii]|uniref:Uncharacterized protein n=1 Tax=Durusdinium trenchii TaxID=1381693 RepID=A0ABP0K475_9DINO
MKASQTRKSYNLGQWMVKCPSPIPLLSHHLNLQHSIALKSFRGRKDVLDLGKLKSSLCITPANIHRVLCQELASGAGQSDWPPRVPAWGLTLRSRSWLRHLPRESSHGVLALVVHDGAWK